MPYTQENRLISLETPLGTDELLLASFSGNEAISHMFSFHLSLLHELSPDVIRPISPDPIKFTDIIGQNVTISVKQTDGSPRYFNGIVSHFSMSGMDQQFIHYQMEVVPWIWRLTHYADCRIFHHKTVQEVIDRVFKDRGFSDYRFNLSGTYSPMEYCVQYRETDLNFISRLMEKNGIFYFFEHDESSHTMVIVDSKTAHKPCPGQENAGFNLAAGGTDEEDVIEEFSMVQELRTGKCSLTDYNFKTPSTSLLVSETSIVSVGGNNTLEIFDHPGEYAVRNDGTAFAKVRMQEEEAGHLLAHGTSVCRAFTTGYKFNLKDYPQSSFNQSYVLTEIQHVASVAASYSSSGGASEEGEENYSNHFTCIPEDVPFRPARLTPRPFVQGPQTAVVVGKSSDQDSADDDSAGGDGEEIWVDKYGRVMVLFPWDRRTDVSCWVRVSQDWAGGGWGMINIPRVGQEVLVSFLEGDPDRPIVTGRVYNAEQLVPYKLPDYGTRTTFKTRSTTGGGDDNYNELRFEDKKGKEQVFLHAEFDQDNYVKNDSREWIGNNRSLLVTNDQTDSIGGDYHEQISKNNTIKIGSDRNEQVGGKEIIKIGSDRNEQVGGNEVIKIGGDRNENVGGNHNEKIGSSLSLQVGQNLYEKSGMNYAHQAGMAIHLKAGMTVVIEAGMELTLKAGGSFIDIGPAGIAISGAPMVMINSGGAAGSGCGSSPVSPTDPVAPKDPKDPDLADDGKSGTKRGSGNAANSGSSGSTSSSTPTTGGFSSAPPVSSAPAAPSLPSLPPVPAAVSAAASQAQQAGQQVLDQVQQAAQQATQEASQVANQAAQAAQQAEQEAQQAANQAQQAAQQAEQQAQQAVDQVKQQASQAYQQANQAVQQAQQAVNQAAAQAQAQAQQALSQVQQLAQQTAQQAAQAVQQAQQQAQQVQQQAQQAAQQAQQAAQQAQQQAQQAAQQAQQAAQQAQQQAQQAAQQAQQQAQQAMQQGQQAVQQAQQQAQQAAQQAKQAAQQAQQQAQQAAQQAQQAAQQAQQQAQQAAQQAQQAGQQVQQAASQSLQQAQQSAQGAQQAAQQAMSGLGHGI